MAETVLVNDNACITMTTATAKKTKIEQADSTEITQVLRGTYGLWGSGMPRDEYVEWTDLQMRHPWARRNFRYYVTRERGKIASSCKVYTLEFASRGKEYRIAGIGAVFTVPEERGRGSAPRMLQAVEQLAREHKFDGLLLYSDVDPAFYEQIGYEILSNHEFYIWMNEPHIERQIMSDRSFVEDLHEHEPELSLVELAEVPLTVLHHRRYLAALPYGQRRSELYWDFKLQREQFLQAHSANDRPQLEMLSMELGSPQGGYAIFEHAGKIMRVLEVIGRPDAREILWRNLLRAALLRRVQLVRGWESVAPSFVQGMRYVSRDAATPMLLPLSDGVHDWLDVAPCPLLELDHF